MPVDAILGSEYLNSKGTFARQIQKWETRMQLSCPVCPVARILSFAIVASFFYCPYTSAQSGSPWPQFQNNPQHTARTSISGPDWNSDADVKVRWTNTLQQFSTLANPVITKEGWVLAGGVGPNGLGFISALRPENGGEVWSVPISTGSPSSAAVGPDGTIYVCASGTVGMSGSLGALYAFAFDAVFKWRFDIPNGLHRPCNSPIVSRSGVVYVTTPPPLNDQVAALFAVNADGSEKWRYEEWGNGTSMAALSNDESHVYAVFHGRLLAFDSQSGQKLWEQVPPNPFANFILGSFGPTVDVTDRIFLVTFEPNRDCGLYGNSLVAYNKDGTFLWERANISCAGLLRAVGSGPTGKLLVSGFNYLFRVDPQTGNQIGNLVVLASTAATALAIDGQGRTYVGTGSAFNLPGSQDGIVGVDSNQVTWFFPTASGISSPAIGADGTLYFFAGNIVFALGEPASPNAPPIITMIAPTSAVQGQALNVVITGSNFQAGATCSFGADINVNSCAFDSPTQLTANVAIATNAALGLRDVTVSNPDGRQAVLLGSFEATAACQVNSVTIETALSNGVIDAEVSGAGCTYTITIRNLRNYWTNFVITPLGGATVEPVGGHLNHYARFGLLPPSNFLPLPVNKSVSFVLRFSSPKQAVSVFVNPTWDSGRAAAFMNFLQALLDVIPLGNSVTLVIDDHQKIVEAYEHMPHLQGAVQAVFQSPPRFAVGLQEVLAFAGDRTEQEVLVQLLADLSVNIASETLKAWMREYWRIVNSLTTIFGNLRAAFFQYPAGSLLFRAQ